MSAQVPLGRLTTAVAVVTVLIASALTTVFALASRADAAPAARQASAVHNSSVRGAGIDAVLQRMLARLAAAQGVHRPGPVTPTQPAPTPSPTSPAPSAPSSPAPSSPAPSSPAPSGPAAPSAPSGTADPSIAGLRLAYADDFDGAKGAPANPQRWNYRPGGDWGNNEMQCYTKGSENAATDGEGNLVITARHTPNRTCPGGRQTTTNQYTSARLDTNGLVSSKYGKIRVRAKVPSAQGVWPAIWLLGNNINNVGWPTCGEIDMMEAIGENTSTVYGTIHGPDGSGRPWQTENGAYKLSSAMDTNFHVYGVDWTPNSLTMSVDGHAYSTLTKSQVLAQGRKWVFDQGFFVVLNVAVGGDWPGTPRNNNVFPRSMTVDYVRAYAQS